MKKILTVISMVLSLFFIVSCGDTGTDTSSIPQPGNPGEPPSGGKPGTPPGGGGFGGGGSSSTVEYKAAVSISEAGAYSGQTYATANTDESALIISSAGSVTVSDMTVTKSGSSNGGDNCNFYGLNAAVLVKDGADAVISGGSVTSNASGANGIFSYGGNGGKNGAQGDGTTVTVTDTAITTTGDGSGGIMTTGGGITKAKNLTVKTSGRSSAAIRTDRGGGTVTVKGGTYSTSGLGSPAIYSTADITVTGADLISTQSEGVCIEGKNSISLINCNMTASNTNMNGNATFLDTIMIYQSMSGDADSGTSSFTMWVGKLTSKNGHVFHVTNTNAVINLSGAEIINEDKSEVLLSVCDDGWSGAKNIATVNARSQKLNGTILVGNGSTLTLNLEEGSAFTGCVSGSITSAKGKAVSSSVGQVNVAIDESSVWTLTADTDISSFTGDASRIILNGHKLTVNGKVLAGTN